MYWTLTRISIFLFMLGFVVDKVAYLGYAQPAAQQPAFDEAAIAEMIARLDSNQFEDRMNATRALIGFGSQAIPSLLAALAAEPSLEVQTRVLEVLERLARGETQLQGGQALEALRMIAGDQQSSLARRAAAKLDTVKSHRRGQAIDSLKNAGALIRMGIVQPFAGGHAREGIEQIVIGPEWKGTADDFQWIVYVGDVYNIVLDGPHVTNEYLRPLTELKSFNLVEIKRAAIDDEGIAMLASLSRCDLLWIKHTPVTDAAIKDLAKLPLRRLQVYGTKITKQGRAALEKSLPETCVLDFRRGGFLGVGPSSFGEPADSQGFHIGEVTPNTAAQRAGLREGDIIVSYDGVVVRQFDQVRDLIAQNAAGDDVKVEYLRNGKKQETTVTLGEWP